MSLSTVTVFAFLFFVGSSSVFACGSIIDMPCSSAGSVTMKVTRRRKVKSINEFMSIDAFGFSPRSRLRLLSISGAPSLELAGDAAHKLVGKALHLGPYLRDRRVHARIRQNTWNRDEKTDDRRHESGRD